MGRSIVTLLAMPVALASVPAVASPPATDSPEGPTPASAPEPGPSSDPNDARRAELRAEIKRGDRLVIGGGVVGGVGVITTLLAMPLLVTAAMERRDDTPGGPLDTEVSADELRFRERAGAVFLGSGLAITAVGATLLGLGITRRKKASRELRSLTVAPAVSLTGADERRLGLSLGLRF